MILRTSILCLAALTLAACQMDVGTLKRTSAGPAPTLCEVSDFSLAVTQAACKVGDKVVFLPQTFGNEQLPIYFAALNCDLDRGVVTTHGGVTCYYQPAKLPDASIKEPAG